LVAKVWDGDGFWYCYQFPRGIDELVKQDATLAQAQQIAQRRLATLLAHIGPQERS
jgi:hypothetical protein